MSERLTKLMAMLEKDPNDPFLDYAIALEHKKAHEHAEANPHKDNGLALILAGHAGGMKTGMHSKMRHTIGDLYLTVAEEVFKQPLEKGFPTGEKKISGIV